MAEDRNDLFWSDDPNTNCRPMEIDWDNLKNYLNDRDGKTLTVEEWKEYFYPKSLKKKEKE